MKHIDTTATVLTKIKTNAKKIKSEQGITLAQAQEISAKQAGYENFHHVITCEANTLKRKKTKSLGSLKLMIYQFGSQTMVRFDVKNEDELNNVTDELDETVQFEGGGFGDMTIIPPDGLKEIISTCKALTQREPAFLDGYAHWVGALVALNKYKEAIKIAVPVIEAVFDLLQTMVTKFQLTNELENRPFFRLVYNLGLAYCKVDQEAAAKELVEKMLVLHPNDNFGFRFIFEPESDE